jgi:hypothetical protein
LEEKFVTSDIVMHSKNIIREAYLSILAKFKPKSQYSLTSSYS